MKRLSLMLLCGLALAGALRAEVLEKTGRTYPIAEEDLIERIHRQIAKGDWKKEMTPEKIRKKLENIKPKDLAHLPRATKDRRWTPDLTWELDFDVTDKEGRVLYPKGYLVDPAPYVQLSGKYVIFDPEDELQMEWFLDSGLNEQARVKVLAAGGSFLKLTERFERPIYYLPRLVVERLKIEALPAVFEQVGEALVVREIGLPQDREVR